MSRTAERTSDEAGRPPPAHGGGESRTTVLAALAANLAIALGKTVAGALTGSAAMLAEAGHSFADTVNQVFLLLGINLSRTRADEKHPHGYGKEAFFWSFLAAIFIFVAGATFSFYEGIRTAIQNGDHTRSTFQLAVAYGVLGMAFVFESASFTVAARAIARSARERGWGVRRFVRESPDLTTKTVLFEDSAALTGLVLAAAGLTLSELTGDEMWDAVGSIGIGFVLAGVSVMLGAQSRRLLLGAAANEETREKLHAVVGSFPEVERIVRMLSMQLGSESVLVTGELQVQRGMDTDQIEDLLRRIDARIAAEIPDVRDTFWELRSEPDAGQPERPGDGAMLRD